MEIGAWSLEFAFKKSGILKMKLTLFAVFLLSIFLYSCQEDKFKSESEYGQFAPADAYEDGSEFAYYGSENSWNRRMFGERPAENQYKRKGQRELLEIIDGNYNEAINYCLQSIVKDSLDLESMFNLTIAYAQTGRLEDAYNIMVEALDKGLPFERFIAGPKKLLVPLYEYEKFRKLKESKNVKLVHGPMLGAVTDSSARIWLRTADPAGVDIIIMNSSGEIIQTKSGNSSAHSDFTTVIEVDHLSAETSYLYQIIVAGETLKSHYTFKTNPEKKYSKLIKIAFGGGAGFTPKHEVMWDVIANTDPNALLLLGDNVYIDLPGMPNEFHDYTYYRRQSRPEFRNLISKIPVYAIWDDHDCAIDDSWMGPYKDKPDWKMPMLEHFKTQWNNPSYGSAEWPACFFKFNIAGIDFFMLDCRFYRTNPFQENPTMLGPDQKQWLKDQLSNSSGVFKVIVSSVPWSFDAKPGSRDTWAGYKEEREEIFQFIESNKIEGVVLLSADRHRSDVWKIERKGGYDFYEFESSQLTNIHTHELMPGALFGYNEKNSFGLLEFNLEKNNPSVTYNIVSIEGEIIESIDVPLSSLSY